MDVRSSPERRALSTLSNNSSQNVPVSPTANLKLLTSVASEFGDALPPVGHLTEPHRNKETDSKTRKDKSLGILCDKFLAMFPLNLPVGCDLIEICLDRVAEQLGIVKRRIYDIINILESLQMASKVAKNRYYWHGCRNLEMTLSQLKSVGLKCGLDVKIQDIQSQQRGGVRLVSGPTCCHPRKLPSVCTSTATDHEYLKTEKQGLPKDDFFCDERTLGVMCQKFIMLFLVSPQCRAVINLDLATRMLVSEAAESESERQMWGNLMQCHKTNGDQDCNVSTKDCRCLLRLKTKVRRLYDIANVLTSLGIIAKLENPPNSIRKPVFFYTGPVVEAASSVSSVTSINIRQSLLSSFNDDENMEMVNKVKFVSYKRKSGLNKNGPPEKLPRTTSDNALDQKKSSSDVNGHQQCSVYHRSSSALVGSKFKSSLLQVAEQELEKLRSSEEIASTDSTVRVRKKLLFSRCHSDSCIQSQSPSFTADFQVSDGNKNHSLKITPQINVEKVVPSASTTSKESFCITVSDLKNKRFTITRKLVEVPSHMLSQKCLEEVSFKIPKVHGQPLSFTLNSVNENQGSNCNYTSIQTASDILNNNKCATYSEPSLSSTQDSSVVGGRSKKSGVKLISKVSSGDLYQAVRVGNVMRLIPLHSYLKRTTSDETK